MAKALGASVHYIWRLGRVPLLFLPIKYLLQSGDTCLILFRERPEAVIVQTPPVFVALISWIYSSLTKASLLIDAHSGSFLSSKWKWSYPLQQWCSKHAKVTIVHVGALERLLRRSKIPATEIGYVGDGLPEIVPYSLPNGFNIVVPSSFEKDEPVEAVLAAAQSLPEVRFFITGDDNRLPRRLRLIRSENVSFTGHLSVPHYFGLLTRSDAVLVLTTQENTFQCGAEEAVLVGKPVITSSTQSLQRTFTRGTVFVDNSPEGIAAGVRYTRAHQDRLTHEIRILKSELDSIWERKRLELISTIVPDQGSLALGHELGKAPGIPQGDSGPGGDS